MIDQRSRSQAVSTIRLIVFAVSCALAACTLTPPLQPAGPTAGPVGGGDPQRPARYGSFANGDFETGTLSSWSTAGNLAITTTSHTGNYAARLGGARVTHLSTLVQSFHLPANASWLSFWYRRRCDDATDDGETFATLATVDSSGAALTLLSPACTESAAWLQAMARVSDYAGQDVRLRFSAGSNASASAAALLVDDVQISLSQPPIAPDCGTDADCGAGTACKSASCEPIIAGGGDSSGCTFDLECGTWQVCSGGSCIVSPPDPSGCDSDIECGTGEVCSDGSCVEEP
jgi:hypothetical protein